MLRARDNQSMIRPEYLNETVQIINFVSSHFLIYDADARRNQSFDEFCGGFCQANEPVRQFYNGMRVLAANASFELENRIDLAYPTSEMFSRSFSLLPNFFGIELEDDGRTLKSVAMIALIFRAEKHRSWTRNMVKQWELGVQTYFEKSFNQGKIEVNTLSPTIVEYDIMMAGKSLQPFLLVGFVIMCTFCTVTTMLSSVIMYHHKASINKQPSRIKTMAQNLLRWYTGVVSDWKVALIVMLVWTMYVGGAIVGLFYVKIDLSPQKMFLPDSKLIQIDSLRNKYMVPFYTPATVVVNNPGNLSDPENVQQLLSLKHAFESLPDAIGPESTKFFLE
ncbi:patched family protein [Ancylostoma ceylanicum]|uniref:Patched family protein n=1 Tax=Ancylostoma ceylanicum TaxID=53326 RepID=A0A0D6MAK6_9BILA|nr:patched family protein [Ancylostoma ceylanicum]